MSKKPKFQTINYDYIHPLNSTIGRKYLVIDPQFKHHFLEEMYCVGVTREGLIQLSFYKDSPVTDLYLGQHQCQLTEEQHEN